MSRYSHIKSELKRIVEAAGVDVHSVVATGADYPRPWASVHHAGTRNDAASEGRSARKLTDTFVVVIRIAASPSGSVEDERDRVAEMVEHRLMTMRPSDYTGDLFDAASYIVTYEGTSDVWETGQGLAEFLATITVTSITIVKDFTNG